MGAPVQRAVTAPAISSGAVSSPASTQVGDLLIFDVWSQGADSATLTHTLQGGFVEWRSHAHNDGTTDGRYSRAVIEATVAGVQSYTPYSIANATANQTSIGCIAVEAGTWDPALLTTPPTSGSLTTTNNAAPNPPSVASLTGDYLVHAVGCWHVTTAGSTQATTMANYAIAAQNANASHVTHLAIAARTMVGLSNATEDPAAFTDNVTPNGCVAATFAIKGAAAAPQESTPTPGAATALGDDLDQTLGAVARTPTPGAATAAGDDLDQTLGAVSRTMTAGSATAAGADILTSSDQEATPAPGAATAAAADLAPTFGPVSRTPGAGQAAAAGADPTATLGAVSRTPGAAIASSAGADMGAELGGVGRSLSAGAAAAGADLDGELGPLERAVTPAAADSGGGWPAVDLGPVGRTIVAGAAAAAGGGIGTAAPPVASQPPAYRYRRSIARRKRRRPPW